MSLHPTQLVPPQPGQQAHAGAWFPLGGQGGNNLVAHITNGNIPDSLPDLLPRPTGQDSQDGEQEDVVMGGSAEGDRRTTETDGGVAAANRQPPPRPHPTQFLGFDVNGRCPMSEVESVDGEESEREAPPTARSKAPPSNRATGELVLENPDSSVRGPQGKRKRPTGRHTEDRWENPILSATAPSNEEKARGRPKAQPDGRSAAGGGRGGGSGSNSSSSSTSSSSNPAVAVVAIAANYGQVSLLGRPQEKPLSQIFQMLHGGNWGRRERGDRMQTDHDTEEETEDELQGEGRADIEAEEEEERERREEGEGEPSDGGSDIDDLTDLLERREWGEEPPEGQQGVRRRAGRGAGSQPAVSLRVALSVEGAREGREEGGGGGEREGNRANGEEEEPDVTIEEWEEKWKFWNSVDLEAGALDDLDIPTDKHISATLHPTLLAILEECTQRIQSDDLAVAERGWKVLFYFPSLFLRVDRRG
eukprot:Cvel_33748.t1-p1 / transcript=Cvel_33748.t1 / gene=Cvel_33748 / organism=Chromera_velia_CCMP2878 / gene_product=hypothetical protein / transcript_product=hypothetical protein / location=Cvel_scaffold5577:1-1425(-) / protein_length=475 / sequence_SO=supercontig / SO=protein_coding / is_pseudo=false